jgi:phosphate transport system permease protein
MTDSAANFGPPPPPLVVPMATGRGGRAPLAQRKRSVLETDRILGLLTRGSAICVVLMLALLVGVLAKASLPSVRAFGPGFVTSREWRPNELERPAHGPDGAVLMEDGEVVMETVPPAFGALPVIYGTVVSSVIALLFAVPLSLGAALFLVRIAPRFRVAGVISFLVEFLAAIPSIAFGIWGLFVLAPFLQGRVEPALKATLGHVPGLGWMFAQVVGEGGGATVRELALTGRDMFCGGLILGIMVLPIITAVSRDVLRAVPRAQIEGTLALGATWWQSCKAMLRYSRSGLFGAVMLGLARAAGETMAVTMVIGNNNQIVASPFAPAQTMSSLLANEFAEASTELHRAALLEVALILLVMSLLLNMVARFLVVGKGRATSD